MDQSGESSGGVTKGSIVWVRRRNGSWWPGKILGPEDLSAAHLTSPRAGTPVKLLGREDASVDWYNLEKSKRVKPFRCGDFDDCIQRAEASQSMPMKKREKYARREDAILHALELEKQQLSQTQSKLDTPHSSFKASAMDSSTVVVEKGSAVTSDALVHLNGDALLGNVTVAEFTGRVNALSRDDSTDEPSSLKKPKDGNELIWEDDIPEGIPRMRGLQDFGLKIAPSKRRHASCAVSDAVRNPQVNSLLHPIPDHDLSIRSTSHSDGSEELAVIHRAKRSRCVYFPEDHSGSMDEKEISQGRMEISPALGESNCNASPSPIEGNASRYLKGGGFVPFELESSESESDSSETEEELDEDEETTSLSEMEFGVLGVRGRGEHGSMSSDEPDDSALSADTSHLSPHDAISVNEAMSIWPMKGKRNVRNLARRTTKTIHERGIIGSANGIQSNGRGIRTGQRSSDWISGFHYSLNDSLYDIDADDRDLDFQFHDLDLDYAATPTSVYRGRGFRSYGINDADDFVCEGQRYNHVFTCRYPDGRRRPTLVEVDLKVQVSYPKERAPIVSTTSKLTGNSIIGHSLKIEAVEDGSSEHLFPSNNDSGNEMIDNNEARALAPAWRTARRTSNFRVPRSHPSAAYDVDDDFAASLSQQERKSLNNVGSGSLGRKGLLVRKSIANVPSSQANRKSSKKLTKRVNLSSSQKIRTLSSIAVEQNFSNRSIYDADCRMDGIIKPDSSGPTTVACIPVKLAFSRLLEKINRPPSKAVIKMVRTSSDTEKGQS